MDLAQTAVFAISEDTRLSTKTSSSQVWQKLPHSITHHRIWFVFIITYIASHNRWILNGKQGTKLCKKLTTRAAKWRQQLLKPTVLNSTKRTHHTHHKQSQQHKQFALQSVVAAIRGYHVYKESWEPSVGDLVTFGRHIGELRHCEVK